MTPPEIVRRSIRRQGASRFTLPSSLASILIFLIITLDVLITSPESQNRTLIAMIGLGSSFYIFVQNWLISPRLNKYWNIYIWTNSVISGLGLSLLIIVLGDVEVAHTLFDILLILTSISIAVLSGRGPTYLLIFICEITYLLVHHQDANSILGLGFLIIPPVVSIVIAETILYLLHVTQEHIRRLESINAFSQQVNSSLEIKEVLNILNPALQASIQADSYYVGLLDDDEIHLALFYDDGEYFNGVQVPKKGTLAGWVIEKQQPLFLPDLRTEVKLDGIEKIIIGKNKTSLSWMGIPMKTAHVNGMLAISSYKPNAFDDADLELLANLAQHTALALDNTLHHRQVEEQTHLDSLTGSYNHGYFLQTLQEHMDKAQVSQQAISLIMLDIDFFKSYNDTFGHQTGDMVLMKLCETIQKNIKKRDFVGRWGGEEFAIALPGATGKETHQIAKRIQKTMQNLVLHDKNHFKIPSPTVSQGISVFPDEADNIDLFVYIADQRLYKAKKRGRNQIEPDKSTWNEPSKKKRDTKQQRSVQSK